MAAISTLAEWEQRLNSLDPTHIELGLSRVAAVSKRLFVETQLPPIVTVAGTNGKGSTVALLQACLQEAGYAVGCYTSPHLVRLNERIAINQLPIADHDFVMALTAVADAQEDVFLTYFEYLTLAAMWHFVHERVDVVLLEVGLGGRLDATNVFDATVAVVTHIGLDHMDWLGDSREKIGFEKAGIFRSGRAAVYADVDPVDSVVDHAHACGAKLYQYAGQQDLPSTPNLLGLPLSTRWGAWAALEQLPPALATTHTERERGFAKAAVPGRFQTLLTQPLVVLDVAHNADSAALLAQKLLEVERSNGAPLHWTAVFAAYADKAIAEIAGPLLATIEHWICCQLDSPRAMSAEALTSTLRELGATAESAPSAVRGYEAALAASSDSESAIIVFGSFETAGAVLQHVATTTSDNSL